MSSPAARPSSRRRFNAVEPLEGRRLLATFTVDATDDAQGAPGTSLRDAVGLANAAAGADTIVFSPTAFPGSAGNVTTTITLRPPGPGATIVVGDAAGLTIQGFADPARVRVSGGGTTALFRVNAGTLALRNLTLSDGIGAQSLGSAQFGGGAVAVAGNATLTATDCRFLGNALGAGAPGSLAGGAVLGADGATLAFTRCLFAGNTATGGEGAAIGGIDDVAVTIVDSRFEGNGNADTAGVVAVGRTNRSVSITGTAFVGSVNSAVQVFLGPNGTGGLTIRDSTFEGGVEPVRNTPRAAVSVQSQAPSSIVTLTNTTISDNGYTGVRAVNVTATLTHCTIAGNRSLTSAAGGVAPPQSGPLLTLRNSIVVGNTRRPSTTEFPADVLNVTMNANAGATGSNNVIGDPLSSGGLAEGANGNRVGRPGASPPNNFLTTADVLGPLGDYGGIVRTRPVLVAGRAYNAGSLANAAGIARDARGEPFARIANGAPDAGAYEVQTITAPRVSEAVFDVDGVNPPGFPHRLELRFETPIDEATLANFDLELVNLTTGQPVPTPAIRVDYEPLASRATFAFPGFANAVLPDGNYRATLPAGAVADVAGTDSAEAFTIDFTVLTGDANRDRTVGFSDLVTLAQNYGTTGRIFSEGNFDYDPEGNVNFADLVLLAQRYGSSLAPAPSVATPAKAALTARKRPAGDLLA